MIDTPFAILICDDHPLFRSGVRRAVVAGLGHEVQVHEVGTLAEATAAVRATRFDAVILDLSLPDGDGVDLLESIRKSPQTRVVVLTGRLLSDVAHLLDQTNVCAVLPKEASVHDIISAISSIDDSERHRSGWASRFERLTEREREVVTAIVAGMSNKEIANHLAVTPETVKAHVASIIARLEVRTRVDVAVVGATIGDQAVPTLSKR